MNPIYENLKNFEFQLPMRGGISFLWFLKIFGFSLNLDNPKFFENVDFLIPIFQNFEKKKTNFFDM